MHSFSGKRGQLSSCVSNIPGVAGFFSCITAMAPTKREIEISRRKRKIDNSMEDESANRQVPGVSMWIMFTCEECELPSKEEEVRTVLLHAGLSISSCDSIKPKGA